MTDPLHTPLAEESEEPLGFLLSRTVNALKAGLRRILVGAGFDLTPEQWGVLRLACRQPGLTQSDLAERTCKDKPTVTRILDRLEDKGLVGRRRNELDRRSHAIVPTDKGLAMFPDMVTVVEAYAAQVFGVLSQDEAASLRGMLGRIAKGAAQAPETSRRSGALTEK